MFSVQVGYSIKSLTVASQLAAKLDRRAKRAGKVGKYTVEKFNEEHYIVHHNLTHEELPEAEEYCQRRKSHDVHSSTGCCVTCHRIIGFAAYSREDGTLIEKNTSRVYLAQMYGIERGTNHNEEVLVVPAHFTETQVKHHLEMIDLPFDEYLNRIAEEYR